MNNMQKLAFLELIQKQIDSKVEENHFFTVTTKYDTTCTNGESSQENSVMLKESVNIIKEFGEFLSFDEGDFRFSVNEDYVRVRFSIYGMSETLDKSIRVSF